MIRGLYKKVISFLIRDTQDKEEDWTIRKRLYPDIPEYDLDGASFIGENPLKTKTYMLENCLSSSVQEKLNEGDIRCLECGVVLKGYISKANVKGYRYICCGNCGYVCKKSTNGNFCVSVNSKSEIKEAHTLFLANRIEYAQYSLERRGAKSNLDNTHPE